MAISSATNNLKCDGPIAANSIILSDARNPLSREDVEGRFEGELSKK